MSLTSLLDSITNRLESRKRSKWSDYRNLVADICDGKEPDADRIASVLADKNASASVRQIIRELEASLQPLRSPVILNGSGYGFFANHSLVMANYLARANSAVINLRELLDQG